MDEPEATSGNEWDSSASGWDDNEAVRGYAAAAFASLRTVLLANSVTLEGSAVIDFGCGTGLLTERLVAGGATVHAVDTSTAMLDVVAAKTVANEWTTIHTSTSLPDEPEAFDMVVCSSVCAFVDDYPATVEELVARLRDGGLFVQWDWERTDDDSHGLSRDEIRDALTTAGLIDVTVSTAFSITVDGQTMSPIMGHGRRPSESSQSEIRSIHV